MQAPEEILKHPSISQSVPGRAYSTQLWDWDTLSRDLEVNGSLNEYYHPDTGAALSHKGFLDWNLLVLEMI